MRKIILFFIVTIAMSISAWALDFDAMQGNSKFQDRDISITSSGLHFNKDGEQINLTLANIFPSAYSISYQLNTGSINPIIRLNIPNNVVAASIKRIFDFSTIADFDSDISWKYKNEKITTKLAKYYYLPQFKCYIETAGVNQTLIFSPLKRSNITKTSIQFDYSVDLTSFNIVSGTIITCYDPIGINNQPSNYKGVIYLMNNSLSTFFQKWNYSSGFDGVSNRTFTNLTPDGDTGLRTLTGDYSRISDIGVLAYHTSAISRTVTMNTSTGASLSNLTVWDSPNSGGWRSAVMFLRNSTRAILIYERGYSGEYGLRLFYEQNRSFGQEAVLLLPQNQSVLKSPRMRQRPNSNETMILMEEGGDNQYYASIAFINLTNYSTEGVRPYYNLTFAMSKNGRMINMSSLNNAQGNSMTAAWTDNGTGAIITMWNMSGSSSLGFGVAPPGNITAFYFNSSTQNITNANAFYPFRGIAGANVSSIVDSEACTMKGFNNKAFFAFMLRNGSNAAFMAAVISDNGTAETGFPRKDSNALGDVNNGVKYAGCYDSAFTDLVWFWWVSGDLGNGEDRKLKYGWYNKTSQLWFNSNLETAMNYTTPNVVNNALYTVKKTDCPEPDCFALSFQDNNGQVWGNTIFNGTNISTAKNILIDNTGTFAAGDSFQFLFAPNITAPTAGGSDTTPPTASGDAQGTFYINDSDVNVGEHINWTLANVEDNVELFAYVFAHNSTGVLINGTSVPLTGSSIRNINYTLINSLTKGSKFCGQFSVNDTSGNTYQTASSGGCITVVDTISPSISSLTNSTTANQSVSITWNTNENANESNTLGLCPSFTGIFNNKNSTFGTSHIQAIGSLVNSTNYCFNTTACDSSGNCASGNFSFTTAANAVQQPFANEQEGDDAILAGINTSEIWIATVYDAYQVGASNLTNQFRGRFDKFAIKGNKRRAINYVSSGESAITGLFNITPTLYVLQLQDLTSAQITQQVGSFINSTYP